MLPDWIRKSFNSRRILAFIIFLAFLAMYIVCSLTYQLASSFTQTESKTDNSGFESMEANILPNDDISFGALSGDSESCPNVLDRMVVGYWRKHGYTKEEMDLVDDALRKTLHHSNLPPTLQRKDGRCGKHVFYISGNVNLNAYFRALCEPESEAPCCFNFRCVNKSVEQCRGPWTYDLRQQVQTEFATWMPEDPTCKVFNVTTEEGACRALRNATVYFIGESLTRQLYISVLGFFRDSRHPTHVLVNNSTRAMQCHKYFRYSPVCTSNILADSIECNGSTRLKYRRLLSSREAKEMLKEFRELSGVKNSWYVAGFGFHNQFQTQTVINDVLTPIFQELAKSPWPKFIWLATHMPTMLQSLTAPRQQPTQVLVYNEQMRAILSEHKVPVMDTTQLTANAMGIDNIHYGKGVNDAKAVILLNFIMEQRRNHTQLLEKQVPDNFTEAQTNETTSTSTTVEGQRETIQRTTTTEAKGQTGTPFLTPASKGTIFFSAVTLPNSTSATVARNRTAPTSTSSKMTTVKSTAATNTP
ncbi:hypothetical protein Btru_025047 [Bulinus truncatus]|nr:hypothetical protein Btru_025047 [Bulinus truncatus]